MNKLPVLSRDDKPKKCKCKRNLSIRGVKCPFDHDVKDTKTVCNCCEECQQDCRDSI